MTQARRTSFLGRLALLAATLLGGADGAPAGEADLVLAPAGHHQVTVSTPADGIWQITTTGDDPYVLTAPTATQADLSVTPMLAFEYQCAGGLDHLQVFVQPGASQERRVDVPALPAREGWSPFAIDLGANAALAAARPRAWRIDLGARPGRVLQIRALRLRARSPAELTTVAQAQARHARDQEWNAALAGYLAAQPQGTLTRIAADAERLRITGTLPAGSAASLAEWPVWQALGATPRFARTWPVPTGGGAFGLTIPRFAEDGADRALSRFVLVRRADSGDTLLSHGRWVDAIPAANTLPAGVQRSRKGLGGYSSGRRPESDLDELGIGSVTVNVVLSSLFQAGPGGGAEAVTAGGRTWHVRAQAFAELDATMLAAARRGIVVLGIILVPPARSWGARELGALLQHPDYDPAGIFTMPNLTTPEGTAAYTLALDLLARRYSRADGRYGRIHHWIMHNEVDMGWVWTNCGRRPELVFLDQYHRSMRLGRAILARQDANAQVFISLTHHWAQSGDPATCFPSLNLLGHLLALTRAEGDFDWGLAHHPYPSSLFEPKSWQDQDAAFRLDTPKITFRNLEVLDAWARQPAALHQGRVRAIHLSEQGPNARDYGEQALREQAASMAYVWKKLSRLDSIMGFEYHNWVDNRGEGGLRIGLRRFPDDQEQPLGAKPVWDVYKALGTPDEDRACAFALPLIGISTWSEAHHTGPIPAH